MNSCILPFLTTLSKEERERKHEFRAAYTEVSDPRERAGMHCDKIFLYRAKIPEQAGATRGDSTSKITVICELRS